MRGAIIDDNSNLKLLPLEQMVDKIPGVWNLSSEQVLVCLLLQILPVCSFSSLFLFFLLVSEKEGKSQLLEAKVHQLTSFLYKKLNFQGNLGMFVITNCRVVWFAELNTLYNVSIPYLTLFSCRVRESKFGMALVLETTSSVNCFFLK